MRQILRHVAAVLVGYVIFAGLAVLLFTLSGRDPHVRQDLLFTAFSILYGLLSAIVAGYFAALIGGHHPLAHARTLAIAIAAVALVSLLARPGGGAVWSQLAAIFLFAPAALVGGWLRTATRRE